MNVSPREKYMVSSLLILLQKPIPPLCNLQYRHQAGDLNRCLFEAYQMLMVAFELLPYNLEIASGEDILKCLFSVFLLFNNLENTICT